MPVPPLPTPGPPPPALSDVAAEVAALRDADLLRLRAIARMRARGLPGLDALDLLNEALVRLLAGTRSRPAHVPLVALLATTMRSVAHEHWRRNRRESAVLVSPRPGEDDAAARQADLSPGVDPERTTAALQALAEIDRLFADDAVALRIVAGLAEGLGAAEIKTRFAIGERDYDSARKRMRRALLRKDGRGGQA